MDMFLEPSEGTQFCQHLDILICKNVRNSCGCWKCNNEQNRRLHIRWICAVLALCLYYSSSINAGENMTKMMSDPLWFNSLWENLKHSKAILKYKKAFGSSAIKILCFKWFLVVVIVTGSCSIAIVVAVAVAQ